VNTIENNDQYDKVILFNYVYGSTINAWKNKSSSFGITGTYKLNENTFFSCNTGIVNINFYEQVDSRMNQSVPGPGYSLATGSFTQTRYYFSPRIGWEMRKNKFGLYGGFALPFTFSKKYKNDGTDIHYDANNVNDYSYNSQIILPGGFSIGVGAFVGFNFYCLKHFSIGAEVSSSYSYYKQGGTYTTTIESIVPPTSTNSNSNLNTVKGFDYSGEKLSFNITYLF
jgi:hypothetical protein